MPMLWSHLLNPAGPATAPLINQEIWGFPKSRGPFFGALIMRIMVSWDQFWVVLGTPHISIVANTSNVPPKDLGNYLGLDVRLVARSSRVIRHPLPTDAFIWP